MSSVLSIHQTQIQIQIQIPIPLSRLLEYRTLLSTWETKINICSSTI